MENGAAKVYDDPIIVEISNGKESVKPKRPSSLQEEEEVRKSDESAVSLCCCVGKKSNDEHLKAAGSTAIYHESTSHGYALTGIDKKIGHFLNSPVYLIFAIILTCMAFIILLVELFVDVGLFQIGRPEDVNKGKEETMNLSNALHWFAFSILALFFIEILFRLAIGRSNLVHDCVTVVDCTVVFITFISNLCVTLVVGPESAIDAISLIICIRLIRCHTLFKVRYLDKWSRNEFDANKSQHLSEVSRLRRQLEEKDFEIKQLRSFLSGHDMQNPRLMESLKSSVKDQDTKGATADTDLELALALSKQTFNEEANGGAVIVNKAFSQKEREAIDEGDGEDLPAFLVHEGRNRLDSQGSEIVTPYKFTSYMDEYFAEKPDQQPNEFLPTSYSTGAIPKRKNLTSPVEHTAWNSEDDYGAALKVLQIDEPPREPIEVVIDPRILQCETPVPDVPNAKNWPSDASALESIDNLRSALSSPPSDVGSLDDCTLDTSSTSGTKPAKNQANFFKHLDKKSGSSVSSESGYLSEDGALRKKRALPASNGNVSSEIETSAL